MTDSIHIHSFGYNDRSGKIRWLAEELGLTIQEHKVDLGAQRQSAYRTLNPFAAIPACVFEGKTLIESTASCIFIAESKPESKLAVFAKEDARYDYLKWISLFSESLEGRLVDVILSQKGLMPEKVKEIYLKSLQFKLRVVTELLPKSGFLVADRFTIADIIAAFSLKIAVLTGIVDWNAVKHYLQPLIERPAAQRSHFFEDLSRVWIEK